MRRRRVELAELFGQPLSGAEQFAGHVKLALVPRAVADPHRPAAWSDGKRGSYRSFLSFSDPDGNGWVLQEITTRLPGRLDPSVTAFTSTADLAAGLRRAAAAHGEHEARIGAADPDWPDWYADYMVREQAGTELPT